MPVKVLIKEKNELRLRVVGESHTSLQMLRERLNKHKDIEYANYFPGHPELDDPEFYDLTMRIHPCSRRYKETITIILANSSNLDSIYGGRVPGT